MLHSNQRGWNITNKILKLIQSDEDDENSKYSWNKYHIKERWNLDRWKGNWKSKDLMNCKLPRVTDWGEWLYKFNINK